MTNSTAASKVLNMGIIGCGLIGQKRAAALGAGGKLVACADTNLARAESLAKKFNVEAYDTWQALIARKDIDAVVIATLHDSLAEITLAAVESGKHVLVAKPAARKAVSSASCISPVRARIAAKIKSLRSVSSNFSE
jgi:predicted dehydrogenase